METFFSPKSIAVIGASANKAKVGYGIIHNLGEAGFPHDLYPINPKEKELEGRPCYPSIKDIPGNVDMAVMCVPPKAILASLDDCAAKGVTAMIVISAGFRESGPEGLKMEEEMVTKAKGLGMRIVGPNCLGLIATQTKVNASFAALTPDEGHIGFFSQSGALCTAILDWAVGNNIGFSKFISLGNKGDLNEADFVSYLADDPETKVILGYVEGIKEGRRFMKECFEASKKKPLIVVKSGGSAAGARAASSHTGALAGSDKAFEAVCKQCGIIRAETVSQLFNLANLFAAQPLPTTQTLAIITNAGGPGILATDASEKAGVELSQFTNQTTTALREGLGPYAAIYNPVDIIGDARADRYKTAIDIIEADPNVGGILVILTPQAMTEVEQTAKTIIDLSNKQEKPIFTSFMGDVTVRTGQEMLQKNGVPNYVYPEPAVFSFSRMVDYINWKNKPAPKPEKFDVDKEKVKAIFDDLKSKGILNVGEREGQSILKAYDFRIPFSLLAKTSDEAVACAEQLGFPVVMKISSPEILHKTEVGGVKVGLKNADEIVQAFNEMTTQASRYLITGVLIQEMIRVGHEVIIGMSHDVQFGPLIMFGLGGIYVEALKDVSFRIAPVDREEALSMIHEIRSFPILAGVRGRRAADLNAITDSIQRLSQLVLDFPEILEADINPLLVGTEGRGAVALDVRFIIKGED